MSAGGGRWRRQGSRLGSRGFRCSWRGGGLQVQDVLLELDNDRVAVGDYHFEVVDLVGGEVKGGVLRSRSRMELRLDFSDGGSKFHCQY